ncbi:MAG TPA: hypothetical protein VMN60_02595 [Longimicrobiales bacterium]|nr:hypothetical protein [Longimicrobiales bacterium]
MSGSRYPTGAPHASVRDLLALRVEDSSLRQVAREVGMSPSGLQKVLDGSTPYTATRRKLERWYVSETRRRYTTRLDAASAAAATALLVRELPPTMRPVAMRRVLALLEELYDNERTRPAWIAELRERADG